MNVLADPWLQVEIDGNRDRHSVAGALARFVGGDPGEVSFPATGAHQRGYLIRFLVRCAARAFREADPSWTTPGAALEDDLAAHVSTVLAEAASGIESWELFAEDHCRPAFLQVPVELGSEPEAAGYSLRSASVLTSLIGGKNHERKVEVNRSLDYEGAVLALLEYQLGSIFGGRGNYATQLTGSGSGKGSGSPFMAVEFPAAFGRTFRHHLHTLLSSEDRIRSEEGLNGDIWALWTAPWDGRTPLPATRLDPFFIPLARMVRIGPPTEGDRVEEVLFRPSKAPRVDDHTSGGGMGDPFLPLIPNPKERDALKVRGTMESGYTYREVAKLLVGEDGARPSPTVVALRSREGDRESRVKLVLEGTAFEQGKTLGFHHRETLLPTQGVRLALGPRGDQARRAHGFMLGSVKRVQSILRGAVRHLMWGTAKPKKGDDAKVNGPASVLENEVDRVYVPRLLEAAEGEVDGDSSWQNEWLDWLSMRAIEVFERAAEGVPRVSARSYGHPVQAEAWLKRKLREFREGE